MKFLPVFVYILGMGCFFHTTCTLAIGNTNVHHKQSGMGRAAKGHPRRRVDKYGQKSGQVFDVKPPDEVTLVIHDAQE